MRTITGYGFNVGLRRRLAILVCLALLSGCRNGDAGTHADTLPPENTPAGAIVLSDRATILVGQAALPLFKQCSRNSPQHITGYWTPSARDVAQLEADAPAFLQSQKVPARVLLSDCYVQYAGIITEGRRAIYVNGFSQSVVRAIAQGSPPEDWQHRAFAPCDGGLAFFGVEYDVQARQFQHLGFNGVG